MDAAKILAADANLGDRECNLSLSPCKNGGFPVRTTRLHRFRLGRQSMCWPRPCIGGSAHFAHLGAQPVIAHRFKTGADLHSELASLVPLDGLTEEANVSMEQLEIH